MYGNSPGLVKLYARFLETIKNDPWRAAEYHAEAERLKEVQQGPKLPDGAWRRNAQGGGTSLAVRTPCW